MLLLLALAAALPFDGEAALRHASALAALGPHPWGSPRTRVAAEYVASQFRAAGLEEVRLEEFESHGIRGANVVGVLRAPGPEFVVVGSHHDTAPDAPGAYDAGGGVGVLIETARVLSARRGRPRTLVFVSWDGEEAWATGRTTTAGSRAFVKALGPRARDLVAAHVIEMCGWKGGTPVLHPFAYRHPLRPGAHVATPAWLMEAALRGSAAAGERLAVGDPLLSWLYQPAVRTFEVGLYGDDLSFLQADLPAVFSSDSSFTAYYPWYHQAEDTPDKLDAASLARMGRAVVGVVDQISVAAKGPLDGQVWFAAGGHVFSRTALLIALLLCLVPGLVRAARAGGPGAPARFGSAALAGVLFWRHPLPAVWVLALPSLVASSPSRALTAVGLLPAFSLAALGMVAWSRGYLRGSWVAGWEAALAVLALGLLFVPMGGRRGGAGRARGAPARPMGRKKRGGR